MLRCFLTVAVAILLLAVGLTGIPMAAPVPKEPPPPKLSETEKAQTELQRTWYGVSFERDMDKTKLPDATLTFEKNEFTLKYGKKIVWKGTYTIDVSKDPNTIDMTVTISQISDNMYKGKVILGVYKLDKDTLQLCIFDPAFERPSLKYPPRGRPGLAPTKPGDYFYTFKKDKP